MNGNHIVEAEEEDEEEKQKQKNNKNCDLLKFFAITRDAAIEKGLCVPVVEAMQLFNKFHLSSVCFDA